MKEYPAKATQIITRLMNIELDNNWKQFAAEFWPHYSDLKIRSSFEEKGKMEAILVKLGKKGATTSQLFETLIKIGRNDVIQFLEEKYPSVR